MAVGNERSEREVKAIEEDLLIIAERLLDLTRRHGCTMMSVRVRSDHGYVNCYAFDGNDIVTSVADCVGGGA